MSSPFPGMDPYLENPEFWSEVHNRLIVAIADFLTPLVVPKYRVAIEKRTYLANTHNSVLVGIPDVAVIETQRKSQKLSPPATLTVEHKTNTPTRVHLPIPQWMEESYLEVREVSSGFVITVLEILSPTNKKYGRGRQTYEEKRMEVLASASNLVEIDLLRDGIPLTIIGDVEKTDYRILVSAKKERPLALLYSFNLTDKIPSFYLPLKRDEPEIIINLQRIFEQVYERARYDLVIDYALQAIPPLTGEKQKWVNNWLCQRGLR